MNLERIYSDCGFGRLGKLDASDIYHRRINAKVVSISQKGDEFIFPVADGTAKLSGKDYEFREPTPRWEQNVRSEDFSRELQCEPGESQPTESTDDADARADFWSIQGDFIISITMNLQFNSMCPRKKHHCHDESSELYNQARPKSGLATHSRRFSSQTIGVVGTNRNFGDILEKLRDIRTELVSASQHQTRR